MRDARLSSWAAIGARVAEARTLGGFTQQHLASVLGVHRSAIARIEQGQRQLDALELAQLADTLGRSVDWFLTEPPASFASHRQDGGGDEHVARLEVDLERAARDVQLLVDVGDLRSLLSVEPASVADLEDAEAAAEYARSLVDIPSGPVLELQDVVERTGLCAFARDLGPSVIDGGYVRVDDVGVAVINGSVDPGRRRFNLAHELGHHVLADEYSADVAASMARADREALINAFAIHFLLPRGSVTSRWEQLGAGGLDERARLITIAAEYRVSWTAVLGHARTLGFISKDALSVLSGRHPEPIDYVELGLRFEEELEPPSVPRTYARAVVRAYRRNVISDDRATELLWHTISADDLGPAHELPLNALRLDFKEPT